MIVIIDFGSQYTQLISRRIREIGVYNEILPYDTSFDDMAAKKPGGIILSGGPDSVHRYDSLGIDSRVFDFKVPVLGICYGMQLINKSFGGMVSSSSIHEYGAAELTLTRPSVLFEGVDFNNNKLKVWMSHGDAVTSLPKGFVPVANTRDCEYAAIENNEKQIYGIQFHPEVIHTEQGSKILENFALCVCNVNANWTTSNVLDNMIDSTRDKVKQDGVLLALSGGVDSMVLAHVLRRALPENNLQCVLVDNGLLRENEVEDVVAQCQRSNINLDVVDAKELFLKSLESISEPEAKRKKIGSLFIDVFERYAKNSKKLKWLAQGTIYPDVIESAGAGGKASHVIKSHHNVGGLPEKLGFKVLEPFRALYKDEVRAIGSSMDIDREIIFRHPFPGPGLAIRVLGNISEDKLSLLKKVDSIWIEILKDNDLYYELSQAFSVLLPVNTVGVTGDKRHYGPVVALRAVTTDDFMTAKWANIPVNILELASNRILNEVKDISRVVYDISSKPPATIEWE